MNKLIKNYIYNTAYQIFLIIVPLVTAPYLARTLSSKSLGVYSYINSVVGMITTMGLLGLQSYGYRQIAYDRDCKRKVTETFSSIYSLRIILLLGISLIYIPFSLRSEFKQFYLIQYALIVSQYIDVSWVFIGYEDLKIVSFRNFFAKFLTVVGIFVLIKNDSDLWIYFALFAYVTLITTISVYPIAKRYISFKFQSIHSVTLHIFPALKLFIPQVATTLYLQFDKIMLQQISGSSSQVAYYDYAEKIINIPLAVITALGTVMMPRLANLHANNNEDAIAAYLNKTIKFAMFLAIPMMFGLAAIAPGCMPWYLGEEYQATAYVIIILCPICVLNALSNIFGAQYLTAVNQTRTLAIAYYGAAFVNIVCNAFLIPNFGCFGAAMATVFCSVFSVAVQYVYIRKKIKLKSALYVALKNVLAGLLMVIVVLLVSSKIPVTPISTVMEVLIGIIVYVIIGFLLKDEMLYYIASKGAGIVWSQKERK